MRRPKQSVQLLDGSGDSSLSMIHMIFHFYLQSGEYSFFIKRVKNIAQSKMSLQGDKLRMENQYAKPLRSKSRQGTLQSLSQMNGSQSTISAQNKSNQKNGGKNIDQICNVDTNESVHLVPAQEDEIALQNVKQIPKTKRSQIDQISVERLNLSQKKYSNPEPRKDSFLKRPPEIQFR